MIYRIANINDAANIANLHAESWRNTYRGMMSDAYLDGDVHTERQTHWQTRFDAPTENQYIFVAEKEGKLAGFVCVYGADDAKWGSLIDNLHVLPDLKRRGIGKRLILEGMIWARENYPQSGVYLWVFEANLPSQQFYEVMGGENVERVLHHNEDGTEGYALRYAWSIDPRKYEFDAFDGM
jgi:ribosomal protein S18 acetylase RimI-like enzyme